MDINITAQEYFDELKLMEEQYGQEEDLYPWIYMLLQMTKCGKNVSIRDVHKHGFYTPITSFEKPKNVSKEEWETIREKKWRIRWQLSRGIGHPEFAIITVKEYIKTPYDGQGFICPEYAKIINAQTGIASANSFQIRLPFAKGMLHRVDFHEFLSEFDGEKYALEEEYLIYDAFGRKRDLKKAKIIMTQSMFKCHDWVQKAIGADKDPMAYYCRQLKHYGHKLFVANTDSPYGKSKTSRLSYQMMNTLALDDETFDTLTKQHIRYIDEPTKYMKLCEDEASNDIANWKRALFTNPDFANCHYIKQQLENTQSSLMKQLANGRLVVPGQMRYLVRDLGFMLSRLVQNILHLV